MSPRARAPRAALCPEPDFRRRAELRRQGCAGRLSGWHGGIWSLTTGKPISPTLNHNDVVRTVAFVPKQKAVATGSYDGTVHIWEHPDPVSGSTERIRTWVEVLTRMELLPDGAIRVLDSREWAGGAGRLKSWAEHPHPEKREKIPCLEVHHLEQA